MEGNASTYFCDGLDTLRLEFLTKVYQKLLLILDSAMVHKSKETLQYLDSDPAIEYFFLPAYSPELNPIEICFRIYSKELLENTSFKSKENIIESTTVYCEYYRLLRTEIYG
jgi:transposase